MKFEITTGPVEKPQRVLIYGPEGIGKSTLASQMPDPLFIDVEDGTAHLMCKRLPVPDTWETLMQEIAFVQGGDTGASTIVIDTLDAAERLCQEYVCRKAKKQTLEDWGYGKGYVVAKVEFQNLIDALDKCVGAGLNVVLLAHSQIRKFERPDESGAYDRFELKLNKHVSALCKEWCDALLFADFETFVSVDDNGKAKASGGKRIIRCDHTPQWDAKNRWSLPDKINLDADGIAKIRENLTVVGGETAQPEQTATEQPETVQQIPDAKQASEMTPDELKEHRERYQALPKSFDPLKKLMGEDHITLDEIEAVMVQKGKRERGQVAETWEPAFVDWLVKQWPAVVRLVGELRETRKVAQATDVPF